MMIVMSLVALKITEWTTSVQLWKPVVNDNSNGQKSEIGTSVKTESAKRCVPIKRNE
jgi:hypothetical protein